MGKLSRRNFLKLSAAGAGGGSILLSAGLVPAEASGHVALHKKIGEAQTICPYCSCGCGIIVATDEEGQCTNVEGDPDHPLNRGRLDPKSIALRQLLNSPRRLKNVMYRAAGATDWEVKDWDWAMAQIGQKIKATRDASWVPTVKVSDKDVTVNRTEGLAFLGGAANNCEEGYLHSKLARALGVVYLEHQARI
jgi:formate dehydrogenase major subunit